MKLKYNIAFLAVLALPASAIAATANQARPIITGMGNTTVAVTFGGNGTVLENGHADRGRMAVMEKEKEDDGDDDDGDKDEKALAKANAGIVASVTTAAEKVTKDYKSEKEEEEDGDDDGDEKGEL